MRRLRLRPKVGARTTEEPMFARKWLFVTLFAAACSGGDAKPDEKPDGDTSGGVLAECKAQSDVANKQAQMFANVSTGSRVAMEAAYTDFQRVLSQWEAEDAPCAREGASVTDRMTIQQQTTTALADAETKGTEKMIRFLEPNTDEARELLKTIFASGRKQTDAVIDAATAIDRKYRDRLLGAFREHKKYGQLDDKMKTTCVFNESEIDPNEEITGNFRSNFQGAMTVHALCRIPLPANKFAGDDQGQMVIVLDDDADPANGVLHEGKLGSPEEWKATQWFSGRFTIPQGPGAQTDSGYYYVWIKVVRPTMGDETLVHNWFYWHK